MISTRFSLMANDSKCWDPVCCNTEFPTNEMVLLILLGCSLNPITYQKPREKRLLTPKDDESTCACAYVIKTFWPMGLPRTELLFHLHKYISFISKFRGVGKCVGLRLRRSMSSLALPRAGCVAFSLVDNTFPGVVSITQPLGEGRHWFLGGRRF